MSYTISEITETCERCEFDEATTLKLLSNLPKRRSSQENRSLHKLFKHMADGLNDIGHTFQFKGIKGMDIECKYTPDIVKQCIWKPLQFTLLEKSSTTKLSNKDEKLIFDVLAKWFASEKGIYLVWPAKNEEYKQYLNNKI